MDWVLQIADETLLNHMYPKHIHPDNTYRQMLSIFALTLIGGYILYFGVATFIYMYFFDKRYEQHPKFLKHQIKKEITVAASSIPFMTLFTLPIFVAEVKGYSKLYDNLDNVPYFITSVFMFLFFNDMMIYWIHRGLHHSKVYKHIHKTHHRWLVPSPFASHAFHPLDGFLQSTPYHMFVFLVPLHKGVYLFLFVLVNFWTISIHDGYYAIPPLLTDIVNGAAHHTDHHLYYNYNYGQYTTLWDRIGGSFKTPSSWKHDAPLDHVIEKLSHKPACAF